MSELLTQSLKIGDVLIKSGVIYPGTTTLAFPPSDAAFDGAPVVSLTLIGFDLSNQVSVACHLTKVTESGFSYEFGKVDPHTIINSASARWLAVGKAKVHAG